MRTIELDYRRQCYGRAMSRVLAECERYGIADLWDVDLRHAPAVRAGALAGRTASLACHLEQARHHASLAGLDVAAGLLATRQSELRLLDADAARFAAAPVVDVVVLDADWGKRGRGARIVAAIRAERLTAADVAERFQLALSTARGYVRKAK